MEEQMCFLIVISGFSILGQWVSGSVLDVRVKPGDNITLHCDCPLSTGVYAVWYRNCSHLNQPTLVLKTRKEHSQLNNRGESDQIHPLPRFKFVNNVSSKSYDLLITNITESDEGFYFCGTETSTVVDEKNIYQKPLYTYGKATTRILFNTSLWRGHKPSEPAEPEPKDCGVCWILLFSLCPAFAVLSFLLLLVVVYFVCHKTDVNGADTGVQMSQNEDEDVCYAALEIRQASQRPRRKKTTTDSSDFSTYSAVKTSRE